MNQHIQKAIHYHANQTAKIFKLDQNDREDIRQELTVTALEAVISYDPSQNTKIQTYVKMAITYRTIDIMRGLERSLQIICFEEEYDLQDIESFYERLQRDIHEELTNPTSPAKRRPLQINCGLCLQTIAVCQKTSDLSLQYDIETLLHKVTSRQRLICLLLMKGFIHRKIAGVLGVHQCTVRREIAKIRKLFAAHGYDKY